jgi:hypothetical protein
MARKVLEIYGHEIGHYVKLGLLPCDGDHSVGSSIV